MKNLIVALLLLAACRVPAQPGDHSLGAGFPQGYYLPPEAGLGATTAGNDAGGWSIIQPGTNGQVWGLVNGYPSWISVNAGLVGNIYNPPLFSAWTQVEWISSTSGFNSGNVTLPTVFLQDLYGGGTGQPIRGLQLSRPANPDGGTAINTPYTLTTAITPLLPFASTPECGLFISDGTKFIAFANGSTAGNNILEIKTYATYSSAPSNLLSQDSTFGENGFIWYQIKSDTVHRTYNISNDGWNYLTRYTETISGSTLANTEAYFGFYVAPVNTNGTGVTLASWNATSP
jgi:hypothetical protein